MRIRRTSPQNSNNKIQMNPFMIALAVIQFLACIYESYYGEFPKAALYFCYTVANVILCLM